MLFETFCAALKNLEETTSRNTMTEQLAGLLGELEIGIVDKGCYLLLGRLAPLYKRIDFQMADTMVIRAMARAFVIEVEAIESDYKQMGDLGLVAETHAHRDSSGGLGLAMVYTELKDIALAEGSGSQDQKVEALAGLMRQLSGIEVRYVVRMVLGKLRLGFSDKTVLDALSVLLVGTKGERKALEQAYQIYPDIGHIALLVRTYSTSDLQSYIKMKLGVPIVPALCQRLKSAEEMIAKMGRVVVEPKYDGTRVQIHIDTTVGTAQSFTRSLDETTHMFPELRLGIKQVRAAQVILDAEAVGVDPTTGKLLPFQDTITRKRKHDVALTAEKVPITFFVFDVLFIDGESMLDLPLVERRKRLEQIIDKGDVLVVDPLIETEVPAEIVTFHAAQLAAGLEGAVIKKVDGTYRPGRVGWNWVKFKEVETAVAKLADTIDAVVMGYYIGKGKRSTFGIGAFLVGVWNEAGDLVSIAKIGTGLSDAQWREMKSRLSTIVSMEKPGASKVTDQLACDVWVDPVVVVEVAADEITDSTMHAAGVSLRFPRLVRFRDDKQAEEATHLGEVLTIRELSTSTKA